MIENVHLKIKQIRELKNISREYMAVQLKISTRAYGKIETGETQLYIERLNEISKALSVTPQEILGFDAGVVFNNVNNQQGGSKYINTIYHQTEIKQIQILYEKLLAEKENIVISQKELIQQLKDSLELMKKK